MSLVASPGSGLGAIALAFATLLLSQGCGASPAASSPSDDAGDAVTTCTALECGSQCCLQGECWFVDATGERVDQLPACAPPDAGPLVGPSTSFAGGWSPLSGSGEETCTDGESSALPPNTAAVLTFVADGRDALTVYGGGAASSCGVQLAISGNAASLSPSNQGCTIPDTNGVVVYYSTLTFTLNTPVQAASTEDGGDDAAAEDDASAGDDAGATETLTFQLVSQFTDAVKTCTSSLTYMLGRATGQ